MKAENRITHNAKLMKSARSDGKFLARVEKLAFEISTENKLIINNITGINNGIPKTGNPPINKDAFHRRCFIF